MLSVSVVIPCFNAANTIGAQLMSIVRQPLLGDFEVIISDNGSTDGSLSIINEYVPIIPNLRIVDSSNKKGPGHARNVGVKASSGEGILFCDADDEVGEGWLEAMAKGLLEHEFVACLLEEKKLNESWQIESWVNNQREGLLRFHPPYLPFAAGTSIGVRRSIHDAIGGFNESIRCFDDIDYCWRVQLAGVKLHLISDAVVHYRYRSSLRSIFRQSRLFGIDAVLLYKKYRPLGMPELRHPWKEGLRRWYRVLTHTPGTLQRAILAKWIRNVGTCVGRLQGSIRYRVCFL